MNGGYGSVLTVLLYLGCDCLVIDPAGMNTIQQFEIKLK